MARAGDELAALDAAIAAQDRATVIDRAHKLAGIAGMFGHRDIGDAAAAMESAALAGVDLAFAARPLRTLLAALAAA